MKAAKIQRQLDAGGLVQAKAKCDSAATEAMVARTYTTPALGTRVVVKLSSDRLVAAEDLAMEYLGLQPQALSPPLARQHRTALDFAHWALIHQPKQARFALELVKRMKAAERRAAAKPGHAWDMYAEMAAELNKSVRHFLPPFWEQAARSFKTLGNMTYAGRALNKALEAERVHALEVDREHRRDAVLEFSLSGCLSGKALSEYSKDLASQFPAQEAYDTYRDLLVRRTLGGMAPTANAGTDLIRLAKAANLQVDNEVESFLELIIGSPAMVRAPMQFWKSVKKQVGSIVKRSDLFGIWLLVHTNPEPRYSGDSIVWDWLDLLESWQALPLLWKPLEELPSEVEIPGGRAGWLSRLLTVEASPDKRAFELVEKMADVLIAEGRAVNLKPTQRWSNWVDVDVLEACLQLGIPVSDDTSKFKLNFSGWLREYVDHPRRNAQLTAVAEDPRFTMRLSEAMEELVNFKGESSQNRRSYGRNMANRRSFETAVVDHPTVRKFWWDYLDSQLNAIERGGVIELEEALSQLTKCVGVETISQFPELTQRLAAVNIAENLQRALIAGVFDEYGWDALDRHVEQHPLAPSRNSYDSNNDAVFPWFCYHSQGEAQIVGPDSARSPQPIVLQKGETLKHLFPIGDDVMMVYRDASYNNYWRWLSQRPESSMSCDIYYGYRGSFEMAQLADGSWFTGTRATREGDKTLPTFDGNWFSDGSRVWKLERVPYDYHFRDDDASQTPPRCHEIDPQSGQPIRESLPPFFETGLPPGSQLEWFQCSLLPSPKMKGQSPLGSQDGLIGWRVVRRRDGSIEGTGIDGRSVLFPADAQPAEGFVTPVGLMDKPATDGHWVLTSQGPIIDQSSQLEILDLSNNSNKYCSGQPIKLSPVFFHLMRIRHLPSSKKMRGTNLKIASKLLQAGAVEHEANKLKETPDSPDPNRHASRSAVEQWLTGAPPRLIAGISKIAKVAAAEQISLDKLIARCQEVTMIDDDSQAELKAQQASIERANEGLLQLELPAIASIHSYRSSEEKHDHAEHIRAVAKFLAGEDTDALPPCSLFWFPLLQDTVAVAYNCFWRTATKVELGDSITQRIQTPWLDALRMYAESGLSKLNAELTLYWQSIAAQPAGKTGKAKSRGLAAKVHTDKPIAFTEGNSRYVAYQFSDYFRSANIVVLERTLKNKPKPPQGMMVEKTICIPKTWSPAFLKAFIAAVEKIDKLPLPDPKDIDDAANELGMHPIAVGMTFMGNLRTNMYGQEKLTKEIRDFYKWKVKDIQVAIAQLEAEPAPDNVGCEFARHNPSDALGEKLSLAVRRMMMAWKASREERVTIPAELANVIEKANKGYRSLSTNKYAELISTPETADYLRERKATIEISKRRNDDKLLEARYEPSWGADASHFLFYLTRAIATTNYALPAGHELRRKIPELINAARAFIDNPQTMLPFGGNYSQFDHDSNIDANTPQATFSSLVGELTKGADGVQRGDDGLIVLGLLPPRVVCLMRTANLKNEADLLRIQSVAAKTFEYQAACESMIHAAVGVLKLRGPVFDELLAWNENPPVPAGSWDQDPRASAPDLVAVIAKKFKISTAAAALYLQVLALPDPSSKNVRQWNEWTAKELTAASGELLAKELVVQAKRARAGRDIFLPGGWETLALPNLPIESWKLPLFGYESIEAFRGYYAEYIVCEETLRSLYQRAWDRVASGDPPRYEEAQVLKGRKK